MVNVVPVPIAHEHHHDHELRDLLWCHSSTVGWLPNNLMRNWLASLSGWSVFCYKTIAFYLGPDEARGFPFMEFRYWVTNMTPITTIRQPTRVLKKRAPGCLVWTKPYTPLEVTRIRSVRPSFEKSSQIKACVGAAGSSTDVNRLPPGDIIMASWSPAARISSLLSCARNEKAFRVGTTILSIIPDGDGRFDHVAPVKSCHCQMASWPCKPGEYDVTWKK